MRSQNMRRIRSKNTTPEMLVRHLVHKMGFRYRLHVKSLPSRPDLVFRKHFKIILVHGCFWHQHPNCPNAREPKSNGHYWLPKLMRNKERDAENREKLEKLGWKVLVIWECGLRDKESAAKRIKEFLSS